VRRTGGPTGFANRFRRPGLRDCDLTGEPSGAKALDFTFTGMRRDLPRLGNTTFDLLVVGAGIYGACAAWDASLRGLSVAVVDQDDFGAATSANSLRIVHGGLRYLARADFSRMMESIRERSTLLRIAPALVQPLKVLVPTYGQGTGGRAAYAAALCLNDLASFGRNRHLDPESRIPGGRIVSRSECLSLFPWFQRQGLSGGALWYDAQLQHPERLTLSFLQSASAIGAVPVNYFRVDRLLTGPRGIEGACGADRLTGAQLEIRAHSVLVAAGPWTAEIVRTAVDKPRMKPVRNQALALNLIVSRRMAEVAVGVQARSGRAQDPVCGGRRFLFCAPHGTGTVLGTWYTADVGNLEASLQCGMTALMQEFNDACPGLDLSPDEVVRPQWGRLPLKSGLEPGRDDALAERPLIIDHAQHGVDRLISVEGVKFTTGRLVAEQSIDQVFTALKRTSPSCRTAELRLEISQAEIPTAGTVSNAETIRAVRDEMAVKLSDVVFRRTDLGTFPGPARAGVEQAARAMSAELGWSASQVEQEVEAVLKQAGTSGHALESVA
jgi:glycerol-3-phosphate dehydrogenase